MMGKSSMTLSEDYKQKKEKEMQWALDIVRQIEEDPRECVKYRDSRPITDIKNMIETSVETYGRNHPLFYQKFNKKRKFEMKTYGQMLDDVYALGTSLTDMGLKGKRIAVMGENCSQWAISYLGIICGTGIVVPVDKELSLQEVQVLIERAEVNAVIFTAKYEKLFKTIKSCGETVLETLININAEEDEDGVLAWQPLVKKGGELIEKGDRRFIDAEIDNEKMCALLFTSGTTGVSKGVMLSHKNLALDLMASPTVLKVNDWDMFFSVLPLHHTYECTSGFLMPLYKGAAIAYCEGLKYIMKNLQEVKPTMFLGVPVMFEKIYHNIWKNVRKQGRDKALRRMIRFNKRTKKIGIDISGPAFKKIRAAFGGNLRIMICGGAAINPEVLEGIQAFGIQALQGYGLTECAPMGALSPDRAPKSNSVGVAFPTCGIKIEDKDEDGIGEICLRGDNVMLGYYHMPEATAKVKREDGWFHTGDLGYLDEDDYLVITGRQKNVIITKNGKNVSPEELEYYINNTGIVEEAMVFAQNSETGDDTVIAAAVKLDDETFSERYPYELSDDEKEKIIWTEVDKINAMLPVFKRIRRLIIRKEAFEKNTSNKIVRFAEGNKR